MYKFKYGGKNGTQYQLEEAKDLVVVRTKSDKDLKDIKMSEASRSLLPKLLQVGHFPEANVNVYKVVEKTARSAKSTRDNVRKTLSKEKEVKFAGRVLKDKKSGSIFIYTENFFIKFNDDITVKRCREILKKYKLKVKDKLKFAKNSYFAQAKTGTGLEIFDIANGLLGHKEVEYAHPELIREKKHKFIHQNQWHLKKTKVNGKTINQHVEIEKAWKITKGKGITIAIVDDGVDTNHPEFKGKIVAPRDTLLKTSNAKPKHAGENHGTACAGVACAKGIKASGVAPEAKLMPIRAGGLGSLSEAYAFVWAADNGADIISCSWGPADGAWWHTNDPLHVTRFDLPDSTRLAINYAIDNGRNGKGCIITWAAGNGNENVSFDGYASYEKVIAVAACNDRGKKSVYSDFGKEVFCCFPSNDFFFPQFNSPRPLSDGIWTTDRLGSDGYEPGDYTSSFGGTSSACPGVAGVIALMLSVNPDIKWSDLKLLLIDCCDKIDDEFGNYDTTGHSPFYGYGRINAFKVVQKAKNLIIADPDDVIINDDVVVIDPQDNGQGAEEDTTTESDTPVTTYKITGTAQFSNAPDIKITNGRMTKELDHSFRLLGFTLNLKPLPKKLGLKYRAVVNNKGKTAFAKQGEYCGVKDKRRKLIGFSVELTGALAKKYDVIYKAIFDEQRDKTITAKNGEMLGKSSGRGKSIERLSVAIKKK